MTSFQLLITDVADKIEGFNLVEMYKLPQSIDIFNYAQQFLRMQKRTKSVASHPTSVTWVASFMTWLAERKGYDRYAYPFEFDNDESELTWLHDMLILAAGFLGITLVPTNNLHGFHNTAYKMGIS
jgi:hypothetical protein